MLREAALPVFEITLTAEVASPSSYRYYLQLFLKIKMFELSDKSGGLAALLHKFVPYCENHFGSVI